MGQSDPHHCCRHRPRIKASDPYPGPHFDHRRLETLNPFNPLQRRSLCWKWQWGSRSPLSGDFQSECTHISHVLRHEKHLSVQSSFAPHARPRVTRAHTPKKEQEILLAFLRLLASPPALDRPSPDPYLLSSHEEDVGTAGHVSFFRS